MHIKVRVLSEGRKENIEKIDANTMRITVKEKPKDGRANKRVLELLREYFATRAVTLVSGAHSRSKIAEIKSPIPKT